MVGDREGMIVGACVGAAVGNFVGAAVTNGLSPNQVSIISYAARG